MFRRLCVFILVVVRNAAKLCRRRYWAEEWSGEAGLALGWQSSHALIFATQLP